MITTMKGTPVNAIEHFARAPFSKVGRVVGFLSIVALLLFVTVLVGSAAGAVGGFGQEGEGAGELSEPHGVGVADGSGAVYVVDTGNQRVERWSGEGVFERMWGKGVNVASHGRLCVAGEVCGPGEVGTGAGEFHSPAGVAVDNSLGLSGGDVYVVDRGNLRVERFSADGEFILMFGKGVNAVTHGNVCVAGEGCQAGEEDSGPGGFAGFEANVGIAVDSLGRVYVGELERVEVFSAAGVFESEIAAPGVGYVTSVAVDAASDVYVVGTAANGVYKYDGAGTKLGEPRDAGESGASIAVGSAGELFVYDGVHEHVLEFDSAGTQVSAFVQEGPSTGIAFASSLGGLYVLHGPLLPEVSVVSPPAPGPVVMAGGERVDGVLPTSTVAHAVVNPEGPAATSVHFEFGLTAAYGSSTIPQTLGGGAFEDQPVQASLGGLSPETLYHFRVVVTNGSQTTSGPDQTFVSAASVSVESESAAEVTSSSVRLGAVLNAHGVASEFHFEYGTSMAYGQSAPVPDGDAGSDSVGVPVAPVLVQGLASGTVYHYRVLARNALGVSVGPDGVFVTQGAAPAGLADGRGWELVSPPEKHGVALEAMAQEGAEIQAAEDGHAITYIAKGPVSGEAAGSRSVLNTQLLSRRGGAGWGTVDISTPHEKVVGFIVGGLSEYQVFSSDLSVGFLEPSGATPLAPALMGEHGERTPYRREANGAYTPLVTVSNTPPGVHFGGTESQPSAFQNGVTTVGMTPDGSHVVLSSTQPLSEGFPAGEKSSLFEWGDGVLTPLSLVPPAAASVCGGAGPACVVPAGGEALSSALGNESKQVRGAVSSNGARVIFEGRESFVGHLFLRDVARGETVRLDVPVAGVKPALSGSAQFQIATADGSRVFFTDTARLTADATSNETMAAGSGPDLYVCDVSLAGGHLSCALRDLTVDANRNESANVLGDVIGIDGDGRFVYFVANGALAPGAVHGTCGGSFGFEEVASSSCNLYVRDVDSGLTSLVGVVSGRDASDWRAGHGSSLMEVTSRVSSNGRFFAFMSSRSLTGFDNRDARSGELDAEVFEFDRVRGSLTCVSCDPSGARPVGVFDPPAFPGLLVDRQKVWQEQWLAGSLPGWTNYNVVTAWYQSRYLSDSGRLFFNSPVGLVAADGNGREDVYEFEPAGVGGCGSGSDCVALMSSGGSGEDSAFLDASSSGDDVFFLSAAKLVAGDTDGALDVYDAHVCSGSLPCPSGVMSVPPACSTADSCRSAPVAQPDLFGAPASATFSGMGNVVAPVAKAKAKAKAPTPVEVRAARLSRALRACKKVRVRKRGRVCERDARRRFGAKNAPVVANSRRSK
jgi:hypothetical protein